MLEITQVEERGLCRIVVGKQCGNYIGRRRR
jgi:hypothetical protein